MCLSFPPFTPYDTLNVSSYIVLSNNLYHSKNLHNRKLRESSLFSTTPLNPVQEYFPSLRGGIQNDPKYHNLFLLLPYHNPLTTSSSAFRHSLLFILSIWGAIPACGLEIIIIAEAAFFILVSLPRQYALEKSTPRAKLRSRKERRELFERCCGSIPEMEAFLSSKVRTCTSYTEKT